MSLIAPLRNLLIVLGLCLATLSSAMAQSMVSIKGSTVNMRAQPNLRSEVLWELKRGYPLRVIKRSGRWLKVRDFENDSGWVARSLTGRSPHHVVKSNTANVRKGPGTRHSIVGKAEYGETLRTLGKRGKWVHIQRSNGQKGWIAKGLLWGF
ncbi:SH3 domain-containing protein [Piscinibacter sakaiensis]|uniref:SH3 domain-containing protein n=1 Tax=Piscinibacter sakaiensis TaxID=1547922 RepID=UPI003AAE54CB